MDALMIVVLELVRETQVIGSHHVQGHMIIILVPVITILVTVHEVTDQLVQVPLRVLALMTLQTVLIMVVRGQLQ